MSEYKTLEYPISENYCKSWSTIAALRELIANALDAVNMDYSKIDMSHAGSHMLLRDYGPGMQLQHLIIGEGEDKTGKQIGQFREGLKLALLVLARERCKVSVRSGTFRVANAEMRTGALGVQTLHLDIEDGMEQSPFTEVMVECTRNSFDCARDLFLAFNPAYKQYANDLGLVAIDYKNGATFVNGMLAQASKNQLGVYVLTGPEAKGAINRDRDRIRVQDVQYLMSDAVESMPVSKIVELIMARQEVGKRDVIEDSVLCYNRDPAWVEAIFLIEGISAVCKDVARASGANRNELQQAQDMGITVIDDSKYYGFTRTIIEKNFQRLGRVVQAVMKRRTTEANARARNAKRKLRQYGSFIGMDPSELEQHELDKLSLAATVVENYEGAYEVFVFEEKDNPDANALGVWIAEQQAIGINRRIIAEHSSLSTLLGVYAHEVVHATSGALDGTREFEQSLTYRLGNLLDKLRIVDNVLPAINPLVPPKSPKRRLLNVIPVHHSAEVIHEFIEWMSQRHGCISIRIPESTRKMIDSRKWAAPKEYGLCGSCKLTSVLSKQDKVMVGNLGIGLNVTAYRKGKILSVAVTRYRADLNVDPEADLFGEFLKEKGYAVA